MNKPSIFFYKLAFVFAFSFTAPNLSAQKVKNDSFAERVKTVDGTVNEILDIISGKKGEKRDWEAFRLLFAPKAQLSVMVHDSVGRGVLRTYTLEEFVRIGMRFYEGDGFIEYELKKTVDEYNGIAHVFQGYYAKELDTEEKGINSFQLYYDGKRWWITSLLWVSDRNGVKLPEKYDKRGA
ncbi:hypothetical protein FUAX_42900 (plasmid) [Fulvitalea axinellae]|uniref:Nuclear transport factor 2 family protein n=1 Tax=Fulvitalea axinellae TaxID=1182444 RepID=A0AAU9D768_9BACT|nr:hypothetical protein FUAX_42900 [Fulvitalea axinellae]